MKHQNLGIIIVSVLLLIISGFVSLPQDNVVFLDVGQGDAILLQHGTQQVLIDGGQGMAVLERLGEELPWFDRTIEVIIATHPDRDHLEGLLHVVERYRVGLVLLPRMPHSSQLQEAWLTRLQDLVASKSVQYRFAWQGQRIHVDDEVTLEILGPFSYDGEIVAPAGKTNNGAVLTRIDYCPTAAARSVDWAPRRSSQNEGGSCLSFLLTSDAEAAVERMLVRAFSDPLPPPLAGDSPFVRGRKLLDVDILKAGHHGSKTSTTPELLQAASPSAVVISVGADNRYGHPHPDVLERLGGIGLWRTDHHGSVRFSYRENHWWLATER